MSTKNKTTITAEPGKQELFITREFDAPCELVYRAHIDPELYVQWLGPRGYEMVLETFEPYSGGRWRYIHKDEQGNEFGFHGVFHEISPERMIQTFEFDGTARERSCHSRYDETGITAREPDQDQHSICLPVCGGSGRHDPVRHGKGRE